VGRSENRINRSCRDSGRGGGTGGEVALCICSKLQALGNFSEGKAVKSETNLKVRLSPGSSLYLGVGESNFGNSEKCIRAPYEIGLKGGLRSCQEVHDRRLIF